MFAQNMNCEAIISFINQKENQIAHLNLQDPDYIPLHFLIAQDVIKELQQFRMNVIPYYSECKMITFNQLINKYDELNLTIQQKHDSLEWLNNNVHLLFYEKACFEYQINNEEDGKYLLDRSLQYNATFPNAVLLKLNKLLDNNYFKESLSLLNTLYYEIEMDDEQEKQAIEFTDKFYDKLYKTADSLLKVEHAAEALELFEVLEVFCQNLPTAYCNDDYYHGVLNSKAGIYDSYIAIAKVAEKRGNGQIATHFYQYAQDYLRNNPHLGKGEREKGEREKGEREKAEREKGEREKAEREKAEREKGERVKAEREKAERVKGEKVEDEKGFAVLNFVEPLSSKELKEKYDSMVLQALALCIKEDFSASYKIFSEAKKLEDCNCFETDFRVNLMIRELSKIELK